MLTNKENARRRYIRYTGFAIYGIAMTFTLLACTKTITGTPVAESVSASMTNVSNPSNGSNPTSYSDDFSGSPSNSRSSGDSSETSRSISAVCSDLLPRINHMIDTDENLIAYANSHSNSMVWSEFRTRVSDAISATKALHNAYPEYLSANTSDSFRSALKNFSDAVDHHYEALHEMQDRGDNEEALSFHRYNDSIDERNAMLEPLHVQCRR